MTNSVSEEIGIDIDKLRSIFRKNIIWILLILAATNITAYLVIRWTKPMFESESILRLQMKEDANILGLGNLQETQDDLLAGEIELIRSKLFLNLVIDQVDLSTSYYFAGNVLNDEKFRSSPILVDVVNSDGSLLDQRIYVRVLDESTFKAAIGSESSLDDSPVYRYDQLISWPGLSFRLYLTKFFEPDLDFRTFFFVMNSRDATLNYLQNNITVEPDKEYAKTIRIAFRDQSVTKAVVLVNTIDTLYIKYTNQKKNKENEQKIAWLNSELRKIEGQLEGYENYIEKFTIENRTSDLNADLRKTLQVMNELDSQRYEFSVKIRQLNNLINDLDDETSELQIYDLSSVKFPESIQEGLDQLDDLYRRKQRLELSYRESTMAIQQINESILNAKQILDGRLTAWKENLEEELVNIERTKSMLENEFTRLPGKSNEYNKNKRFYELYEQFYLSLLQSKAEFEIARAGTNTDFEILSPATRPDVPIYPNKILIHGFGFVAGLILSFFTIGILYLTDNKIGTLQELERYTSLSILGSVPTASVRSDISQLIVDQSPKSAVSESLRSIRTNIQFMTSKAEHKIVSVTSTIGGEGKTFISVNLGGIMAASSKKVILLDLDMRKPRVHLSFQHENDEKGISTILINKYDFRECIRKTRLGDLDYIPAGPTPPNPSELIMKPEFNRLLEELVNMYDLVILDTPPIGLVTDGILIMEKADICLYIIRSGYSKKDFTQTLNRLGKDATLRSKIAVILNAVPRLGTSRYGYGYYSDGGKS